MPKGKPGRPRKDTLEEETVQKLISVFRLDVSDKTACEYAGIARDTYYRWLKQDQVFSDKIQTAKNYARIAAGQVVVRAITEDKDVATAKWWLEKKHPDEFATRPEQYQDNRQVNIYVTKEELAERILRLAED